jgi:hypothetical protein
MWKLPQICISALAGKSIVCILLSQKQGPVRLCSRLITPALKTRAAQLSGDADNNGLCPRLTRNYARSPIPRGGLDTTVGFQISFLYGFAIIEGTWVLRLREQVAFYLPWSQKADAPVCSCPEHGYQKLICND